MTPADLALLDGLFRASAKRAPTEAEVHDLLRLEYLFRDEVPAPLRDALDALASQREARGPFAEAAEWCLFVDDLSAGLPGSGTNLEWPKRRVALTLPGLPLVLTLGGGAAPGWRVGPAPVRLRPDERGEDRLSLLIAPSLDALVSACEIPCVAGCCGLGAFVVNSTVISAWLGRAGRGAGEAARIELEAALAELADAPDDAIVSYRMNAYWGATNCEAYLREWHDALVEALR
jgi:hypothetical protein